MFHLFPFFSRFFLHSLHWGSLHSSCRVWHLLQNKPLENSFCWDEKGLRKLGQPQPTLELLVAAQLCLKPNVPLDVPITQASKSLLAPRLFCSLISILNWSVITFNEKSYEWQKWHRSPFELQIQVFIQCARDVTTVLHALILLEKVLKQFEELLPSILGPTHMVRPPRDCPRCFALKGLTFAVSRQRSGTPKPLGAQKILSPRHQTGLFTLVHLGFALIGL